MNYVELAYNALNAKYNSIAEEKRYEVIRLMNEGGSVEEIDTEISVWALSLQKGQLLNSMVDRKDETQIQEPITETETIGDAPQS
tara:strand:- start:703 stop:957 length:255 start_codon:yes stop_codon:yes gene_type:complete